MLNLAMQGEQRKPLFYFSRKGPAPPVGRVLVSGVIEAESLEAARARLGAALAKGPDGAENFEFSELAAVPSTPSGILTITMKE